jgi:hypothetical protein
VIKSPLRPQPRLAFAPGLLFQGTANHPSEVAKARLISEPDLFEQRVPYASPLLRQLSGGAAADGVAFDQFVGDDAR